MNYIVCTVGFGECKVERVSSYEEAQRLGNKWATELNCEVIVAKIEGVYGRKTEWRPRVAAVKPGAES